MFACTPHRMLPAVYDIADHREKGRPIRVSFKGDLRTQQDLAAHRLLAYDHGL